MPHPMIILMKVVEANRTIDFLYAEEMYVLSVKCVFKFS